MDEATVGLDPASRTQMLGEVVRLSQTRGLGVLWATHLVDEAELAHRIVVLDKGKVLFDGLAPELCRQQDRASLEEAFLKLTGAELFLMLPFFLLGIAVLGAKKLGRLLWSILLYYLILFIYQLNNNQWSSTDAYMLLPFLTLYIVVFYAAVFHINKFKLQYVLPVLVVIQIAIPGCRPSSFRKTSSQK